VAPVSGNIYCSFVVVNMKIIAAARSRQCAGDDDGAAAVMMAFEA
jgi:Flp pilus assembly protein TadG